MAQFIVRKYKKGDKIDDPKKKTETVNDAEETKTSSSTIDNESAVDERPTITWKGVGDFYQDDIIRRANEGLASHAESLGFSNKRTAGFINKVNDMLELMAEGKLTRSAGGAFIDATGERSSTGSFKTGLFGNPIVDDNTSYNDAAYYLGKIMSTASSTRDIKRLNEQSVARSKSNGPIIGVADPKRGSNQTTDQTAKIEDVTADTTEVQDNPLANYDENTLRRYLQDVVNKGVDHYIIPGDVFNPESKAKYRFIDQDYDLDKIPHPDILNRIQGMITDMDTNSPRISESDLRFGEGVAGKHVIDLTSFVPSIKSKNYGIYKVSDKASETGMNDRFILVPGRYDDSGNFIRKKGDPIEGAVIQLENGLYTFVDQNGREFDLGTYNKNGSLSFVNSLDFSRPSEQLFDYLYNNPETANKSGSQALSTLLENIIAENLATKSNVSDNTYIWKTYKKDPKTNQHVSRNIVIQKLDDGRIQVGRPAQNKLHKEGGRLILSASIGNKINKVAQEYKVEEAEKSDIEKEYGDDVLNYIETGRYSPRISGNKVATDDLGVDISYQEYLRLGSSFADLVSTGLAFTPGASKASAMLGVGSTAATAWADFSDKNVSLWDATKNLAVNLGLDLVSLLPGSKSKNVSKVAKTFNNIYPTVATIIATTSILNSPEEREATLNSFKKLGSLDGMKTIDADDTRRINVVGRAILLGKNKISSSKKLGEKTRTKHTGDQYEYTVNVKDGSSNYKQKVWIPKDQVDKGKLTKTKLVKHAAEQIGNDSKNISIPAKGKVTAETFDKVIPASRAEYRRAAWLMPRYDDGSPKKFMQNTLLGGNDGFDVKIGDNYIQSKINTRNRNKPKKVELKTEEQIESASRTTLDKVKEKAKSTFKRKSKVKSSDDNVTTKPTKVSSSNLKDNYAKDYKVIYNDKTRSTKVVGDDAKLGENEKFVNNYKEYSKLNKDGLVNEDNLIRDINNFLSGTPTSKTTPSVEKSESEVKTGSKPKVEDKPKEGVTKSEPKQKQEGVKVDTKEVADKKPALEKAKKLAKNSRKEDQEFKDRQDLIIARVKSDISNMGKTESNPLVKPLIDSRKIAMASSKSSKTNVDKALTAAKKINKTIKKDSKKDNTEKANVKKAKKAATTIKAKDKAKPKSTKTKKKEPKQLDLFADNKPKANSTKKKTKKLFDGGGLLYDSKYKTGKDYSLIRHNGVNSKQLFSDFMKDLPELVNKHGQANVFGRMNRLFDHQTDWTRATGNTLKNPVYASHDKTFSQIEKDYNFLNPTGDTRLRTNTAGRGATESSSKFFDNLGGDRNNLRRLIVDKSDADAFNKLATEKGYTWRAYRQPGAQDSSYRILPNSDLNNPIYSSALGKSTFLKDMKNPSDITKVPGLNVDDKITIPNTRSTADVESPVDTTRGNTDDAPNKNNSKILEGLFGKNRNFKIQQEDIIELGRMGRGISINNQIAKIQKRALKPLYVDTPEHFSPVHGDFLSKQSAAAKSADLRSLAGKTRTSDASLQLAGELEAGSQANAINYDAGLKDNAMFRETQTRDWTNRAKGHEGRVEAANRNRSAGLQIGKAKADIEAYRKNANFTQVLNPFLANIENRYTQNRAAQKQFDIDADLSRIDLETGSLMRREWNTVNSNTASEEEKASALERYKQLANDRRVQINNVRRKHMKHNYLFSYKKGGSLNADDRMRIQQAKDFNKRMRDDQKTFYKNLDNVMKENGRMIRTLSPLTASMIKDAMSI